MAGTWERTGRHHRAYVVGGVVALVCVVASLVYMATGDGFSVVDAASPALSYLGVFALVALDGVVPVFPGETTLNAASTAAAQGVLDLAPVIVAGALGAIVGDSALFWLARRFTARIEPQLEKARANPRVTQALEVMDSSAPVLIVGGRYVPRKGDAGAVTFGTGRGARCSRAWGRARNGRAPESEREE